MYTTQDLATAFQNCSQTNKQLRDQAEQTLKNLAKDRSYPILLFGYIQDPNSNTEFQLRAAIQLKQWFEEYGKADNYTNHNLQEVAQQIKQNIVQLYINTPQALANQLEDTIVIIAKKDFFKNYENLLQLLFQNVDVQFSSQQTTLNNLKILKILKRIIEKYEYSMRSDPLYEEIIYVCDNTHNILLQMTTNLLNQMQNSNFIIEKLKVLKILMRIFYFLNYQDLHPSFEDNIQSWMGLMKSIIKLQVEMQNLGGNDFILFKCKGECLKCILLYVTKYREEFQELISNFSVEIWTMCTITNQDSKFDKIVLNALKYFKNLCLWPDMRPQLESNISTLMNSLLIPNLGISQKDFTMFNDEAESFIQTYFEQADSTSRRGITVDLLKTLSKFIQGVIPAYKQALDQGQQDQGQEITLINLVIDGSSAAFRTVDGVSELHLPADLITYFYQNIVKPNIMNVFLKLQQNENSLVDQFCQPILIAFYLRYFFYFRNHIPRDQILELAKISSFMTKTKSEALRQIAAYTCENLLMLKENVKDLYNVNYVFNNSNVEPTIQVVLQNLYFVIKANPIDVYILKAINQILNILKEKSVTYNTAFGDLYRDQLQKLLSGYDFQKALLIFDGIGMVLHYTSIGNPKSLSDLEGLLQNDLNTILNHNKTDLIAFVIQVYAIFVKGEDLYNKPNYKSLITSMLEVGNWSENNAALLPAYIVYMEAYIQKNPDILVQNLEKIKAIITQLFQLKMDTMIFQFIDMIQNFLSIDNFRNSGLCDFVIQTSFQYYQSLLQNGNKSVKGEFVKSFIIFICKMMLKNSASAVLQDFNKNQANLLQNFLVAVQSHYQEISLIKTISNYNDRKIVYVAITDLLFQCIQQMDQQSWGQLINGLMENSSNYLRSTFTSYKENIGGTINQGDSGFQKLKVLFDPNRVNQLKNIANEDKYFAAQFNEFYSNPHIKNSFNFGQILTEQNQKTLSKLIQDIQQQPSGQK